MRLGSQGTRLVSTPSYNRVDEVLDKVRRIVGGENGSDESMNRHFRCSCCQVADDYVCWGERIVSSRSPSLLASLVLTHSDDKYLGNIFGIVPTPKC